ncbi:hypothetical protein H2248_010271 [Termitomyces sp. 'cryptogamus']|nr:hypothetical protein H2248_010271 [Termitomyces sp. 'cryptogamus']
MAYMAYEYDPYAPAVAYRHAQGLSYMQHDGAYSSAAAYPSTTSAAAVAVAATAAAADYTHGGPAPAPAAITGYNTYADPTTPVHAHAHAYTLTSSHQLLGAAGLDPPVRSTPSALTHHEEYLPNTFDTLPLQLRPGRGGEDAYAGYVDGYGVPRRVQGGDAHERELEHASDERGSYCEPDAEQPRVLKVANA